MNICECEKLNPLSRDGTSQLQRMIDALHPSYIKVDERSFEDILIYLRKYSEYLKYVDSTDENTKDSNWLEFIENDITIIISEIIKTDLAQLKKDYNLLLESIDEDPEKQKLIALFEIILGIAKKIERWFSHSVKELSLYKDLSLIKESSLNKISNELITLYNKASAKLKFASPGTKVKGSIDKYIITMTLNLGPISEAYYNALSKIVNSSPGYMKESLEKYPSHQPHFALLLSFLELFKYAQENINTITESHLKFFYEEILHIGRQKEIPDQVHLIFELAKNFTSYVLPIGTLLKAGKDETGVEVLYKTDKELVINNAVVGLLKTVYVDHYTVGNNKLIRNIYSSPVADSPDGQGGDFIGDEEKWKTFGESQWDSTANNYKEEDDRTMTFANIGFAIVSPQFILKEGSRRINLLIHVSDVDETTSNELAKLTTSNFEFYISGKKSWLKLESPDDDVGFSNNVLLFTLNLGEDKPEITAYNKAKLGGSFDIEYPVLKILLSNKNNPYEYLKNLKISSIEINVSVNGIKNLILQNDVGKIDAKKPFQPFGNSPVIGSSFYIGSEEIFNKKVSELTIKYDWLGKPESLHDHYKGYGKYQPENDSVFKIHAEIVDKKNKTPKLVAEKSLFYSSPIVYENMIESRAEELETFTEFSNELNRGFIKLSLAGKDFCHKDYANILTTTIVNKDTPNVDTDGDGKEDEYVIPKGPYTPLMKSILVDYYSNETFDCDYEKFYHIYPFGEVETTPVKTTSTKSSNKNILAVDTANLLPAFVYDEKEQEGFLYIGISKLVPPQNLALLFKISDGSGDPELIVPDLNWCYLVNNCWEKLDKSKILSDSTNSFKTTGIIEFDFPSDATNNNTILNPGYHWLSVSVEKDSPAVNQMIKIIAQAVAVSFKNNGNDPNYLLTPLVENTISKLETRVPEIKSITQPYASFGGKVKEQSKEYYRRVSERLRHKNRAINIWDYERLVLEKFPSIYKVKCINHTGVDSELCPGSVTVIPISNLRNKNAVNLLEPKTSANTLDEIHKYLSKYISPFVTLGVENPVYEKIQTKFNVKFYTGIDKGMYLQKLKEDIVKFLSPWAFDEGYDIAFGGKIHASYIINFIEDLSYVDYITNFEMYHIINDIIPSTCTEVAETTSAKSILVSFSEHNVTIIN
jgi:hypothetical protein